MWRLFIVILRNSGRTMRRKKDISIGISPCPYNPLIDNKSNELLILLSNMYLLLPAKVFPTRECVAWKLHCCLLSDPLWFWSRAEAGSRYNGGHWRRIIRTSASGLSGLQHSVPGVVRGRGETHSCSVSYSPLPNTGVRSNGHGRLVTILKALTPGPAARPCNWARFCTLQKMCGVMHSF